MRTKMAVVSLALVIFSGCSHNTQVLTITGDPTVSGVEGTVSADGTRFTTCDGDEVDLGKVGNHTVSNTSQPCPAPKFRHQLPPDLKRKAAVQK
jgi:hypothetical protein